VETVQIRHVKNRQFAGWDDAGHGIVMDALPDFKGEGTGPRPITLVLYALGACTAMDVVSVLEKKRQDVTGLEITVQGTQREDEYPHIWQDITLEYVVTGHGVKPEAVARAIELSEDKYCSVKGMFGPQVRVSTTYRVVEA
jgi:putative redox protein